VRWQCRANSVASQKWRRTRAALKRLRGVVGKRRPAGAAGRAERAAGCAGCGGSADCGDSADCAGCGGCAGCAGCAGCTAGSMAAGSYMRGGARRPLPAYMRERAAVFAGDVFLGSRERALGRAGAGACWRAESQRLRRVCGWRYLGWFRHGIFGDSRGRVGGEARARAGVSGV
jgi:hypothetical protein